MGKVIDMRDWFKPVQSPNHPAVSITVQLPANADLDPLREAGLLFDHWGIDCFVSNWDEEHRLVLATKTEAEAVETVRCWQAQDVRS